MKLIKIGKLQKPFGVDGALKYSVKEHFLEHMLATDILFVSTKDGKIPYFVKEYRDNNPPTVVFEDVDSPEVAVLLSMGELFLREKDVELVKDREGLPPMQALVGYELYNSKQLIGRIEEVLEYPQQLMASLTYEGQSILIPLPEQFVVDVDVKKKQLITVLPEGIIESQL